MVTAESLAILRSLADPSRLMLLNALLDRPQYVEELAERTRLAASTVSFHLKKLESVGLVLRQKEQYYAVYSANRDALAVTLMELVSVGDAERHLQDERMKGYRDKVLKAFLRDGRIVRLPVQRKKRRIVLESVAALLRTGRAYAEEEINAVIAGRCDDYVTARRELIEEGLLSRREGSYRLVAGISGARPFCEGPGGGKRKERIMDRKAELKRQYKENPPPPGIYKISNKANGKIFIGKGMNVQGKLNGQKAELRMGSHRNPELQQDWNRFGADQFAFEVIDCLEPSAADPRQDARSDLAALERLWLVKLRPYGERGYNRAPEG